MLKKAGYILLTSLLIISTVGFVVSRHYCDQMLISVAVDAAADKCSDSMNGDCCHDESEYILLKTDFLQPIVEHLSIVVVDVFHVEFNSFLIEPITENTHSYCITIPPNLGKHNLLSLIQSFLC